MTTFVADLDRGKSGSPDRLDAAVWAISELCVEKVPYHGLFTWYEQQAALAKAAVA